MTLSKWMRQATDALTKTIVKAADLLPKLQSRGIVLINADGTVAEVGDLAQTRVEHHKALVLQRS
jgi:hypothetical protein